MTPLALAAVFWLALHGLAAGIGRPALVAWLGEKIFRALFAVASLAVIVWLARSYAAAPVVVLWHAGGMGRAGAAVLMLAAFLLLGLSIGPQNPTSLPAALAMPGRFPIAGVTRITRHPMLWAFSLWAIAHMGVNGDIASLVFFGSFLLVALNGMVSIERKRRRGAPEAWDAFAAATSRLPFAAIMAGRNRLALGEFSLWRLGLGLGFYVLFVTLHRTLFGVPAMGF
jgi:uncharacterized membrane protein